jgi:AraC-like DNA-binding protein
MISFDPKRPDFTPYGLACGRWSPAPMPRPDHHNEVQLNLLKSGWLTYLLGGRKVRIEAGRMSAFWAAIPHQIIELGTDREYFVATIPFAWFLQWRLSDSFVQPMLRGVLHCEPPPGRGRLDQDLFAQWEADLQKSRSEIKDVVLLEMRARVMRLAAALPPVPAVTSKSSHRHAALQDGGLNKVEQMACLLAQRYTEPLTVSDIGKAVDLHPNYAMSLFRKAFGATLIEYLTHQRVSHAQRLLATTDQKIVEVAFDSGFNSISRFNEAFRRICGCSPREYRLHHELSG